MSYKEYLNCWNYNFVQELLTSQAFAPIYKLTQKAGISWYELTRKVFEVISDKNFKGELKDLFNQFCQESHNELFNSEQEAIDFYSEAKNYKSLEQTRNDYPLYDPQENTCFHFQNNLNTRLLERDSYVPKMPGCL